MDIEVVLKDVDLSPLADERVSRRVEKITQRMDGETRVRVTLSAVHGDLTAHVRLFAAGQELVGTATSRENVVTAFDEAVARLERRIARRSEKLKRTDRGIRGTTGEARMERSWARWQAS